MLLMFCLSSCGNKTSEQPITQDVTETQTTSSVENTFSSDDNISQTGDVFEEKDTDLDAQKQQKVLDIADTLIAKEYGSTVFTDLRAKAIVASDGNWFVVCFAYDCTSNPYGTPTEVFSTFYVDHFTTDVDGNLIAKVEWSQGNIIAISEGTSISVPGYYYPCRHFDSLRGAAWAGNWMAFDETHIINEGIALIADGQTYANDNTENQNGSSKVGDTTTSTFTSIEGQWYELDIENNGVPKSNGISLDVSYDSLAYSVFDIYWGEEYENIYVADVTAFWGAESASFSFLYDGLEATGTIYYRDGYIDLIIDSSSIPLIPVSGWTFSK